MTEWAQIFTGLLFYAHVEMYQLWRLVFDKLPIVSTAFKYMYIHVYHVYQVMLDLPLSLQWSV